MDRKNAHSHDKKKRNATAKLVVGTANWRCLVWLGLLISASVAFSLGLACATPFAAFAAAAALTLSRRDALVLVTSVWFANQVVGFTALHYPWTANTFAWGIALGVVAVLATLASQWAVKRSGNAARVFSFAVTFLLAFLVYEAALFALSVGLLGGAEVFTGVIQGRIFVINAAAFAGLLALSRLAAIVGSSLVQGAHSSWQHGALRPDRLPPIGPYLRSVSTYRSSLVPSGNLPIS